MTETQQLLADYVASGSEPAFRELVSRYVNLVYSAAIRLVNGDAHLAEDVTQTVFAELARQARTLRSETMLGGWLHRHTCFVASKALRSERRRLARERQAVAMSELQDHSEANLAALTPVLDEAVNELSPEDRAAILLRYFEQQDFRSVGAALGSNEEAARKRVDRALDKLHGLLKVRGVTLSGAALATALSASAVAAAPVGLAVTASSFALASAAAGAGTTLTLLEIISMAKLKFGVIAAVVVAGVAIPCVMLQRTQSQLETTNAALDLQKSQYENLVAENERLAKLAAKPAPAPVVDNSSSLELLRLRGEVARLRQDLASERTTTNGPSALSGIKADPAMWKVIRDQQKMGMGQIYKDFARKMELTPEQTEKLNDLLADNIMENIDHVTAVLRDGLSPAEMEPIFAGQEAALLEKIQALLGPEALGKYQDYTRELAAGITAMQFKSKLTGEPDEQEAKARQLHKLIQDEVRQTLAGLGLPADFQVVPMLNFRNIASESEAQKNLQLIDDVYARTISKAGGFLTAKDLEQFEEFRKQVISANQATLIMNRKMMAPSAQ